MKISSYYIGAPVQGLTKQSAVWGSDGAYSTPLAYLQRPKWIKDDLVWARIVDSISCSLPDNFEVK